MSLLLRVNALLITVLVLAGVLVASVCSALLRANAKRGVVQTAQLMIDSALAMRTYTADEIAPLLSEQMKTRFLPQSIPFYAATQHFLQLRRQHPEFYYKEASLNPTNPRDRATDWEADIIQQFRNNPATQELQGERDTPSGRSLYLARPIRAEAGCLECHGLASAAPPTLIARYGKDNGFGWQVNEVIGAQIVSTPFADANASAAHIFRGVMSAVIAGLVAVLVLVNAALYWLVVRPLQRISGLAEQVSLGDMSVPDFPGGGGRELAALAASFSRLRKSLEKALKLIGS